MDCRDVRELADSFLGEELLTETNHEILRHLERCPACRADLAARRAVRDGMRRAFAQAAQLEPSPEFLASLRDRLRSAAIDPPARRRAGMRAWWGLAAALVLAVTAGLAYRGRGGAEWAALSRAAAGDHRNCALQFRLAEKPITLDEAARRYGVVYRVVETLPPDDISTTAGPAHVLERHACIYMGRRFAHIVLEFRGARVSLLVADTSGGTDARPGVSDVAIEAPRSVDGLSLVSFRASRRLVFMTGELAASDLTALADAVGPPLRQALSGL